MKKKKRFAKRITRGCARAAFFLVLELIADERVGAPHDPTTKASKRKRTKDNEKDNENENENEHKRVREHRQARCWPSVCKVRCMPKVWLAPK